MTGGQQGSAAVTLTGEFFKTIPKMTQPNDSSEAAGASDQFLKRYLMVLGFLILAGLAYWAANLDSRVGEINDKLATAPVLRDYPYRFRVLSLENGVAVMTSPRSAEMGPLHFLRILDPSLINKDVVHPDMMAAQDLLAEKQSEAAQIVSAEPDVKRIRWQLDEKWYAEQGFFLPD
jgi:hypothetical protein